MPKKKEDIQSRCIELFGRVRTGGTFLHYLFIVLIIIIMIIFSIELIAYTESGSIDNSVFVRLTQKSTIRNRIILERVGNWNQFRVQVGRVHEKILEDYDNLNGYDPDITQKIIDFFASNIDANVTIQNGDYFTKPLIWAAKIGHLGLVDFLITQGADVNARDSLGYSALMYASVGPYLERGYWQEVDYLLRAGADTEATNDLGETALYLAAGCSEDNSEVVKVLLAGGARTNSKAINSKRPLMSAVESGHPGVVRLFLEYNIWIDARDEHANSSLILVAAKPIFTEADMEIAENLIVSGAMLDAQNDSGRTTLMEAAIRGRKELVIKLLDRGADVNKTDYTGINALALVLLGSLNSEEKTEIINILLDNGADVYSETTSGDTAMTYAASMGFSSLIEKLIEKGYETDTRTGDHSETALMHAARTGNNQTVRLLLDNGADNKLRNKKGLTAAQIAYSAGHESTGRRLKFLE